METVDLLTSDDLEKLNRFLEPDPIGDIDQKDAASNYKDEQKKMPLRKNPIQISQHNDATPVTKTRTVRPSIELQYSSDILGFCHDCNQNATKTFLNSDALERAHHFFV